MLTRHRQERLKTGIDLWTDLQQSGVGRRRAEWDIDLNPIYSDESAQQLTTTTSIIHCPNGTIIGQSSIIVRVGHGSDNEKKMMSKMKKAMHS